MEGPHLAVSGHNGNISMEKHAKSFICALTTLQLGLMSYIFIALFRDTPITYICRSAVDGQMAENSKIWPKWPFMAIWPSDQV